MLWNYPRAHQLPICIETLHQANIFGVAVLPESNNSCLVTGAMDHSVQVHRLDHNPLHPRHPPLQALCGMQTRDQYIVQYRMLILLESAETQIELILVLLCRYASHSQAHRSSPQQWYHTNEGPPLKVRTVNADTKVYDFHSGRVKVRAT